MGSTRRGNILNPNPRAYVRTIAGKAPDPVSGDVEVAPGDVLGLNAALAALEAVANKGQPGGYVGIKDDGSVDGRWQIMGGTAAEIGATTPFLYELVYVTDEFGLRIGDGVTPGGNRLSGARVVVQDFSASATGNYYLDHLNADVLVVRAHAPPGTVCVLSMQAQPAGGAAGSWGITPGRDVGQRLTIQFDLSVTSDPDTGLGSVAVQLNGARFGWNVGVGLYQGVSLRRYGTEVNRDLATGAALTCGDAIELIWDGVAWRERGAYQTVGNNTSGTYAFVAGAWCNAGSYAIAVGRQLNVNTAPQFGATFGDANKSQGNYGLTGGSTTFSPPSGTYCITWGNGINYSASAWGEGHALTRGRGNRARWPFSDSIGHAFGSSDWGAAQVTTYLASAVTTAGANVADLSPGGGSGAAVGAGQGVYTIPPKTAITFLYNVIGYNTTAPGVAKFTGEVTVWRDDANNTAILHQLQYATAASASMAGAGLAITADDVNERLKLTVTGPGVGAAVRWTCALRGAEAAGAAAT